MFSSDIRIDDLRHVISEKSKGENSIFHSEYKVNLKKKIQTNAFKKLTPLPPSKQVSTIKKYLLHIVLNWKKKYIYTVDKYMRSLFRFTNSCYYIWNNIGDFVFIKRAKYLVFKVLQITYEPNHVCSISSFEDKSGVFFYFITQKYYLTGERKSISNLHR